MVTCGDLEMDDRMNLEQPDGKVASKRGQPDGKEAGGSF